MFLNIFGLIFHGKTHENNKINEDSVSQNLFNIFLCGCLLFEMGKQTWKFAVIFGWNIPKREIFLESLNDLLENSKK